MEEYYTVKEKKLNFLERIYYPEVIRGLRITAKHFFVNIGFHILHLFGIAKDRKSGVTIYYPEEKHFIPDIWRGRHRLAKREDGSVKCVACMLCATICPANCISITPEEHPDKTIEKYPLKYEINLLKCVFCGYCVEACPVNAILMDLKKVDLADYSREKFILQKEDLMVDKK